MTESKQYIIFKIGEEDYGIDIQSVKTIERIMSFARVPKAAPYVNGVINLRGEIIPVMSLRKRFDIAADEFSNSTRIIIIELEGNSLGYIVDEVKEVLSLSSDNIENSQSIDEKDIDKEFILGVGKIDESIVTLLNLKALVESSFQVDKKDE